jgi:hypothetical protein
MGAPIAGFIMSSADQARWQFTAFTALLTIVSGCQAIVGLSTHISSTVLLCLVGLFIGMDKQSNLLFPLLLNTLT